MTNNNKKDGYRQRNVRQFLHIIWLPHESHAAMSLPTADLRLQPAGIWLRQESLRHIFASPGYAPGTIAVNVTWMERGLNARQRHCSIYIYLQPFPRYSEILV